MKKYLIVFFAVFILIVVNSCRKDKNLPADYKPTLYNLMIPARFPVPVIPAENPLTVEGVKLGRMLYYDPILSTNGLSCSSCHLKEHSFSMPVYVAKTGERISVPPHVNLAWNTEYNWNGSEAKLEHLPLYDFTPDIFNTDMPLLVQKFLKHPEYPLLFKQAFNTNDISTLSYPELQQKMVYAITQFLRTMVSSNSKYDKMLKREVNFTPEELDGMETFVTERGDCFHCHGDPLMTSNTFNNTGLDSLPVGPNQGLFHVTNNVFDIGKFSSPTLRNIELTAPYMHDGRFKTLEEVVEFYNSGVHWNSPNIDPLMTKAAKKYGLGLTSQQKANLVKFLKSLTDTTFVNNPDYQNPL